MAADRRQKAEAEVLEALSVVVDPDLHQDIVSLGFVQNLAIEGDQVAFDLQLTTPACPVRDHLREQCEQAVLSLDWAHGVKVTLTSQVRGGRGGGTDALSQVAHLVAVASAKGGVGKSTTTVQLAYALAATGAKVGILDADIQGPSVHHMTSAEGPVPSGEGMMDPAEHHGVKIVSMGFFVPALRPALLRGPRLTAIIQQFLTEFRWGELDYLLVDFPPGTGDIQMALAQMTSLTGAVLVTTPQEVALLDVRRAVSMFKMLKVPVLGVVENMSGFVCPDCGSQHALFGEGGGAALAEAAGVPLLGSVPIDPTVRQAMDEGQPLLLGPHRDSPMAQAYGAAAAALASAISVQQANQGPALKSFDFTWKEMGA